jgi:hypothetical protein
MILLRMDNNRLIGKLVREALLNEDVRKADFHVTKSALLGRLGMSVSEIEFCTLYVVAE